MRRLGWVLVSAMLASLPAVVFGAATRATRLTADGRSAGGRFSPAGDAIAYHRYGRKVMAPNGTYGSEVVVSVRAGSRDRELCHFAPELPAGGRWDTRTAVPGLHWLPSGRYIVANDLGPGLRLLAADGSLDSRAGRQGEWFVTNDPVPLDRYDAAALNRWLREGGKTEEIRMPWLYTQAGEYVGATYGTDAARKLLAESPDWYLGGGSVSQDGRHAVFCMEDRHFAGCECCGGYRNVHLGQLDLLTKALTQLTFTARNRQLFPILSPDGAWIAYHRSTKGGGPGECPPPSDLWAMRRDGWADRRLVSSIVSSHEWLNNEWIVYRTSEWPDGQVQLGVVNGRTGEGQLLTKGPFRHRLSDYREGRFLIEEHAPGRQDFRTTPAWEYTSDLYVIEPLRVRM